MSSKTKPKARIAANGYRLCDPLPKGQSLVDSNKGEWILGSPVGSGGFGDIYTCRRKGDRSDNYVMKLDNHDGPLFAEMNFYRRVAGEEQIKNFKTQHKLKFLGMPRFVAAGIHDTSSTVANRLNKQTNGTNSQAKGNRNKPTEKYRFLVMDRFGTDLKNYIDDKGLSLESAADISTKMIDVLQYIHSFGYIHADIKAANILHSNSKSKSNDWFLVDFGLADRYLQPDGSHRANNPDKKRANNGTAEYRSRDAHIGLISRRSDIECLAYNMIQWFDGNLPWMAVISDAKKVEDMKNKFMADIDKSLKKCFRKTVPSNLKDFFREVSKIGYESEPNYSSLKRLLTAKTATKRTANTSVSDTSVRSVRSLRSDRSSHSVINISDSDTDSESSESDTEELPQTSKPRKQSTPKRAKTTNSKPKSKSPITRSSSPEPTTAANGVETEAMRAIREQMLKKKNEKKTKSKRK